MNTLRGWEIETHSTVWTICRRTWESELLCQISIYHCSFIKTRYLGARSAPIFYLWLIEIWFLRAITECVSSKLKSQFYPSYCVCPVNWNLNLLASYCSVVNWNVTLTRTTVCVCRSGIEISLLRTTVVCVAVGLKSRYGRPTVIRIKLKYRFGTCCVVQ